MMPQRVAVAVTVLVLISLASTYHFKLQRQIEANANGANEAALTELRGDVTKLQHQIKANANGTNQAVLTELRSDVTKLQHQIKANANGANQAVLTELRSDVTKLQHQMGANTDDDAVSQLRTDLVKLQGQMEANTDDDAVSQLRTDLAKLQSQMGANTDDDAVSQLRTDLAKLQGQMEANTEVGAVSAPLPELPVGKPNGWSHTLSNPTCASRIEALQQEESDLGRFALATTVAGFQILVHKTDDIVSSSLLSQGSWEQDHLKATMEHHEALDRGPYEKTYLDVGANLGYFSLMAATHGFKVTAFEAMKLNAKMINVSLCANPSLEKLVTLNNIGLSDSAKTCYIVSGWNNRADGLVKCDIDPETYKPDPKEPYYIRGSIQLGTINDLLDQDYFMMKMDIEGHEPVALSKQASSAYFNKYSIKYMVTESHQNAQRAGYLKQLANLGYALRPVDYAFSGRHMVEKGALLDVDNSNTYERYAMIDVFCEKLDPSSAAGVG